MASHIAERRSTVVRRVWTRLRSCGLSGASRCLGDVIAAPTVHTSFSSALCSPVFLDCDSDSHCFSVGVRNALCWDCQVSVRVVPCNGTVQDMTFIKYEHMLLDILNYRYRAALPERLHVAACEACGAGVAPRSSKDLSRHLGLRTIMRK
eukprot:581873-Amphidinium_carterae.1